MDIERIEELIKVLQSSTADEVSVRKGGFGVSIRRGAGKRVAPGAAREQPPSTPTQAPHAEPEPVECYVRAPMVGIFHRVNGMPVSGATISPGDVVGTIESMKLLNDVVSDVAGVLGEVLVEEGTPVEFGQPLCRVEPEHGRE